jgi:two-component system, sensor histidine kinase and response regulator
LNAALHLESVIEDALDMSRIENNQFTIYQQMFNLQTTITEVCDIMRFQLSQKGLDLNILINENVPERILTDPKRFK